MRTATKKLVRRLTLLLATWPGLLLAQDFLPPEHLVRSAISQQAEVLAANARTEAAQARARAYAAGTHEFQLSASPRHRKTDREGNFREWEGEIGRAIRLPGKARLDRQIGLHGLNAAGLYLDDARHQAARKLMAAWMNHLRTGLTADETRRQRDSLQRQRDALSRQMQLGDASRLDMNLFDAELAQAEAACLQAETAQQAARLDMMKEFPQIPLPEQIRPLPDPEPLSGTADSWIELIVSRSHEIGAAEENTTQQESIAARARADRFADPSVGLRISSERDGEEKIIGLVFSLPLGGSYRRATAAAEGATATAMQSDAAAVRRTIEREASLTVAAVDSMLRQWQAQRLAYEAMTAANQRMRKAWELGEIGLAEHLLTERNARQTALAEANARVDAWEARLNMLIDSHELWHSGHHDDNH
ncbi:MAG: TolC family protein [Xanthomonadaceae bacterium]|jgi:outer membrane protein TolC|nr:TolC family protein [Xanthomonadaceae bacterium]